jgi:hypothetical protein
VCDADVRTIAETISRLSADKWLAHQIVFRHRHQHGGVPVEPATFHREMVADFWSDDRYSILLAFRGSGKSTIGEEDIALAAVLRRYHNILIIGASEARAAERLASVAFELRQNDYLTDHFGDQVGPVWTQTKLVTTHNVCIQALGRDQDIRGIKFLDYRPDFVFVDDFEDKDNVLTPEGRVKTMRWFLAELLQACDPSRNVRIRATPMNEDAVPLRLGREAGWPSKTFPIEYIDEAGMRRASWPAAFPLPWIDRERRIYERLGELGVWDREMMCKAVSDSDQVFRKEMIRVEPRVRSWQACYAMIDPARTVNQRSATTGWAVWSWLSNRLVVWGADAQLLLPDEIVALGFDIAERFDPVWLGVEQDGLEQFLLQPFRHEMVRRGLYLPLRGVRAPRGKLDFIRGLQPFFANREAEFAQPLPALTEQLLNFPTGRIDAPNALAYALTMRPGLPIYDNFQAEHVVPDAEYANGRPLFLAANANRAMTAAVLLQVHDGGLTVLADWVAEGSPAELVHTIYTDASLFSDTQRFGQAIPTPRSWDEMLKISGPQQVSLRTPPVWVVPPVHGEKYTNVGLAQAVRALPAEIRFGGDQPQGALHLHDLLGKSARGMPVVEVAGTAKWTLRALSGGYTRALVRGRLQDHAEEGPYRLLMEGLESFLAIMRAGLAERDEEEDTIQNYATDHLGRRYKTAMPQRDRRI